jgi:hypothetical protein
MEENIKKAGFSGEEQSADPAADVHGEKTSVHLSGNKHKVYHLIREMWPAYLIEVLVIILGISITLALEEWRDNSKEEKTERIYQKNLLTDIDTDLQSLKIITESTQGLLVKADRLLGFIKNPGVNTLLPGQLYSDVGGILGRPNFISSDATFSDLKNSGNLHVLKDIQLKNLLFAYYNQVQVIREIQDAEQQATITISGPYFFKRFPLGDAGNQQPGMSSTELQDLSKNIEFGNNVLLRVNNRQELLERYQRAILLGTQLKKSLSAKVGE